MNRFLLSMVVVGAFFSMGWTPVKAEAAVKAKTYNVTVTKNLVRDFDDFYNFKSDGGFVSLRGGIGEWHQTNLLLFTVWTANFKAGTIRVSFVGVQIGSHLSGFGSNSQGDIFQSTGTEGPYDGNLEEEGTNIYIEE